jgi:hypothetical protein
MGLRTGQGVVVTAAAVRGADNGHQSGVFRDDNMDRIPNVAVTGGTVAAGGEVLANRSVDQSAVSVVTVGTVAVMGIGCGAGQGVVVTFGAAGRCDLNQ